MTREDPRWIAFLGKGGAGKSALAGTLCRLLARRGARVLALDADTVPGLARSIGLAPHDEWPLAGAVERREEKGWHLVSSPEETVERFAETGPDGVRFLQFGKLRGPMTAEQRPSAVAFYEILGKLEPGGRIVVADLAAGTRQAYFGWLGRADLALVVVEPSAKSLLTAERLGRLREMHPDLELVGLANKVSSAAERRWMERRLERCGLPCWGAVPADPCFAEAERGGVPPAEACPGSPAVRALEEIARRLLPSPEGGRS